MARLSRFFVKDQPQHIIQRGNNKNIILANERDFLFYLECLAEAAERFCLKIHAYALMTNHLLPSPNESAEHSENGPVARTSLCAIFQLLLWKNGRPVGRPIPSNTDR